MRITPSIGFLNFLLTKSAAQQEKFFGDEEVHCFFFKTCSESHNEKPLLKPILSTKVEVNRYL